MSSDRDNLHENAMMDEAIHWHIRLAEGDSRTWEDFTLWLEADPRHVAAFDTVCDTDHALEQVLGERATAPEMPCNENEPETRPYPARLRWWGGGIAATFALLIAGYSAQYFWADQRYVVQTAPGEHRDIFMTDGTQIALNGATRLELDRHDPRYAALKSGEATFAVTHNAAHPFTLLVGSTPVRDVGTIFDVIRDTDADIIAVKEGSVLFDPDQRAVPLHAGQALTSDPATGSFKLSTVRADSVASWREGRLSYDMSSFSMVAQDISRNI
ncbi:MAG: FecR domain-containing protein, partial [Alphaproteobacteria bacterium]|nr:FecR domain-containing protein [Alphaproteobacteria bacterium]